jgi:hypothetical protein
MERSKANNGDRTSAGIIVSLLSNHSHKILTKSLGRKPLSILLSANSVKTIS